VQGLLVSKAACLSVVKYTIMSLFMWIPKKKRQNFVAIHQFPDKGSIRPFVGRPACFVSHSSQTLTAETDSQSTCTSVRLLLETKTTRRTDYQAYCPTGSAKSAPYPLIFHRILFHRRKELQLSGAQHSFVLSG